MKSKIPKALSPGEEEFAMHCKIYNHKPLREYPFAAKDGRQWRFDFAFIDKLVAVEIEGGTRQGGGHTTHKGFTKDCEKYNHAALKGWRVFRFTTEQVHKGYAIDLMNEVLG